MTVEDHLAFVNALWLTALLMTAPEAHGDTNHRSPHHEESSWLVGVKGVMLSAFPEDGETQVGGGGGLFAERTLIPEWTEVELSASLVRIEDEWVVPVDLLFKKPFHFGWFCPYLGVGPTGVYVGGERRAWFFGGAAVVGAYLWVDRAWAIDIELDYAVVAEDGVQHELTFAAGPTLRF